MAANFPNLVKETGIQVQQPRVPNEVNPQRSTPRHIVIKMPKVKSTGFFFNFKVGNRNKLTIYQMGNNHIKGKWKERIQVSFSYSTFTPLGLKIKGPKELQRNLKFDLVGGLLLILCKCIWGTVPSVRNVAKPPLRKASGGVRLAGRTHVHGQVLPWEIRPALYLDCYETCSC